MKREHALVGSAIVALASLVALARCSATERPPAQPVPGSEPAVAAVTAHPPRDTAAPAGKLAPAGDAPPPSAAASAGAVAAPVEGGVLAPAAPSSSAGARIAQALAAKHPADLELLGRIERELRREPPPEIHALLRRRAEGASREELVTLARALPDLQLRVLALRWVDEVRPAPGAEPGAPAVPGASSGAPPLVKPITKAR
jgi:hypothetical protein